MAKGDKPTHYVRAKDARGNWFQFGAAWPFEMQDGTEALSVRIQSVPLNWDGSFTLIPVREEQE